MSDKCKDCMDIVLSALRPNAKPDDPQCSICGQHYGHSGPKMETELEFFSVLPGAFCTSFIQDVIEPVVTPCNHTFCNMCIGIWLYENDAPTCPLCRSDIALPEEYHYHKVDNSLVDYITTDGLDIPDRLSSPIVAEIVRILNLTTRQLINTEGSHIPFTLNFDTMVADLPKFMVTIARRFYYQAKGETVRADLPFLRPNNPFNFSSHVPETEIQDLEYFSRFDAPLADHPDAQETYKVLVDVILNLDVYRCDEVKCTSAWRCLVRGLCLEVAERTPDADGGIGQYRWLAYVRCVVKALVVWQVYCSQLSGMNMDESVEA